MPEICETLCDVADVLERGGVDGLVLPCADEVSL